LFSSPGRTLNLPVEETPDAEYDPDFTHWASVDSFGAHPIPPCNGYADPACDAPEDVSGNINNAMASGATTIFFPPGVYFVKNSIIPSGKVRHIIGNGAYICPIGDAFKSPSNPTPVVLLDSRLNENLRIEYLNFGRNDDKDGKGFHPGAVFIKHSSPRSLTLSHMQMMPRDGQSGDAPAEIRAAYESAGNSGSLFIEDIFASGGYSGWYFRPGQKVWARQFNSERNGKTNIINDGADFWVLGLKSENGQTLVETRANGRSEILGAWFMSNSHDPVGPPAFLNNEGDVSISCFFRPSDGTNVYPDLVQEIRNGTVRELSRAAAVNYVPPAPQGPPIYYWLPLYTGYRASRGALAGCDIGNLPLRTTAFTCLLR
jgi:hypothetical protein